MFLLGHPNLILCVDHKPLLATMGDQGLADIPNPRLLDFKIKSLAYRFTPMYIPGKDHVVPDAFSRRSDSPVVKHPLTIKDLTRVSHTIKNSARWKDPLTIKDPAREYDALKDPTRRIDPLTIKDPTRDGGTFQDHTRQANPLTISDPVADSTASNVLPGYSNTFGPPHWVSQPNNCAIMAPVVTAAPTLQEVSEADRLEEIMMGQLFAHIAAINHKSEVEALTWERLEAACLASGQYKLLHQTVQQGVSDNIQDWDLQLKEYFVHRHSLSTLGPVVLLHDRPVIPACLRQEVLEHLHACNGGANSMFARASASLYWPNYRVEINRFQAACRTCSKIAPSQPAQPPTAHPEIPTYPFESVVADFFSLEGKNYLAMADRYSGWLSIFILPRDDAPNLIQAIRDYTAYFGIPRILSSDGAPIFTALQTEEFCKRWGIQQRISSAYYPHSNKRAEVAVKSAKRLVRDNLHPDGSLHGDKFCRALLIHRNTPDPSTGVSPAQILFGRQLRDHLPTPLHKFALRSEWQKAAKLREDCFMKRHYAKIEDLSNKSKPLQPLIPGDYVHVQDQAGKTPRQWNKSGKVLEVLPHDSYIVRIDGSYSTTRRNRKFLRKFTPFHKLSDPILPTSPLPPLQENWPDDTLYEPALQIPVSRLQPQPARASPQPVDEPQPVSTPPPATAHEQVRSPRAQEFNQSAQQEFQETNYQQPTRRNNLPRHLRERWILTPPAPVDPPYQSPTQQVDPPYQSPPQQQAQLDYLQFNNINPSRGWTQPVGYYPVQPLQPGESHENTPRYREQQIQTAAKTFLQACLEVFHMNLSDASM